MHRRDALKRGSAGIVATMGFAGCMGSEDGSDDDGSDGEDATDGPETESNDRTGTENSDGGGTSASDDGTETDDGADGNTGTSASEFVRESMGEIRTNAIDELEIVAWESEIANDQFTVRVAVQNTGDQEADAGEYTYRIIPYDESGSEIETNGTTVAYPYPTQMSPGGVGSVEVVPPVDVDPETVASYEIVLDCSSMFAEGVYCSD